MSIPRLQLTPHGGMLYVEHLLRALLSNQGGDQYLIHTSGWRNLRAHYERARTIISATGVKTKLTPLPDLFLHELFKNELLTSQMVFGQTDIVHAIGIRQLPLNTKNIIFTLQDASALTDASTAAACWGFELKTIASLAKRADLITTISEFSAREIVNLIDVPRDKIVVIPNGVEHDIFRLPQATDRTAAMSILSRLGLIEKNYLCFAGGQAPRKNLPRLLQAFDLAKTKYNFADKLVVAGAVKLSPQVEATWNKLKHRDDVIFPGYLEKTDLVRLLQASKALAFPSTYEGFGLPPLEAMACGVPVVCSNAASLPEVVGDAAVFFDPLDIEMMAEALATMTVDSNVREICVARGLERAQLFSWQKCATRTVELYHQLAARNDDKARSSLTV
ncbi:MAG TPA: glycosyltransferase family 1 protein [Planktothrix sp.]